MIKQSILIILFSSVLYSQEKHNSSFELILIENNLSLKIKSVSNNQQFSFQFTDIKPNMTKRDSILNYLLITLNHDFIVVKDPRTTTDDTIYGWILYDCIIKNKVEDQDQFPCVNAKDLQLDLISKKYYRYVGDDPFLRKMDSVVNIGNN